MRPYERLSREDKFVNPWWTYRFETWVMPGGREGEYHYMHTGGCALVVPVLEDGRILMVEQYRYLHRGTYLEIPGGGMKDGEDPEAVAHKELVEETGCDGELEHAGRFVPMNGLCDEVTHVFVARNLRASDAHAKDESEEFVLKRVEPAELDRLIAENAVQDGMTMAAWALARPRILS